MASVLRMLTEIVMLVVLMAGLLMVQPVVSMMFIALQGAAGVLVYSFMRRRLDDCASGCMNADIQMNRSVSRAIRAIKDVQIAGAQQHFLSQFESWSGKYSKLFGSQQAWREAPLLVLETVGFLLLSFAILFMVFGLKYSPLETTGTAALLAVTAWRTLPALNRVVSSMTVVRSSAPQIERLLEQIEEVGDIQVDEHPVASLGAEPVQAKIEVRELCFSYEPGRPVLRDFNLTIPAGSSVGIMGPSGCGKSTLVDLLTGLLVPDSGQILIDGHPLEGDFVYKWRSLIGYVPQFPVIFGGTLAENVALGVSLEQIDRNRVFEVCKMAAVDFLEDLPDGIDTFLGDQGAKLSGGQRQRIAIARALYRSPQVLIFDEATSALDEEKDFAIRRLIRELKGGCTLVVISHRRSTVKDCDNVVFMG
ncbi:MAG: hypothetical protein Kow00100_10910 [Geothermobacteraceae bacterium]